MAIFVLVYQSEAFGVQVELVIYLYFVVSLAMLVFGADVLVRGASGVARNFGISKTVVGLTIVAFGTSMPELAVSLQASFVGKSDLSVGNVVGSNILNILIVLGMLALFVPLTTARRVVTFDLLFLIIISVIFYLLAFDGVISFAGATVLFAIFVWYAYKLIKRERDFDSEKEKTNIFLALLFIVGGVALLAFGSDLMIFSASEIARGFGVSELVIAVTIVAIGTSLPELVTSLMALRTKEMEIAITNVIGSNIFNSLLIISASAFVGNLTIADRLIVADMPLMIFVTLLLFLILFFRHQISRSVGVLFIAIYIAYIFYQLLAG